MQIILTINKPGSFFHILDSISLWSIHTRPSIRKYYKKRFGISGEKKKIIKEYEKIRGKYGWQKLDSDFYPSKSFKEAGRKVKKRLNKKEYEKLQKIMNCFKNNINTLIKENINYLKEKRLKLNKEIKKQQVAEILKEISNFYESSLPTKIYIHLLVNVSSGSGGGANIEPDNHITLEPTNPKIKKKRKRYKDIPVIIHELLHIIERKSKQTKWEKFKSLSKKSKLDFGILHEGIADSIIPEGYLAVKYKLEKNQKVLKYKNIKIVSKKKDKRRWYDTLRKKVSAHIYPLTKNQFDQNKTIFEGDYLKECIKKYKMINLK